MLLQPLGPRPSFCMQDKQQRNTGSIGHVAAAGPPVAVVGTVVSTVHHVAFVSSNDHPVVILSEGPNERIYIVLHPPR